MVTLLWMFSLGAALELGVYVVPFLWRARKVLAPVGVLVTGFASGALVAWRPNVFSVVIFVLSVYRLTNVLRIMQARMHEAYLRWATRRTGIMLLGMQVVVGVGWVAWQYGHTDGYTTWAVVAGVQVAGAGVLLITILRRLSRTRWPRKSSALSDSELPTLTVAIPARNETEDLQQCLSSVMASDYPKLEVVVLDDCSQDKQTSEIIRGFAHSGVRFIQGEVPHETWLAKNQALDRLATQASGDYILFCGVDVRFAPDSLRQLVATMLHRKKSMLCVLPWRSAKAKGFALTQAMRYWWELAPPRRLFKRPPVLSTCWIIEAEALRKFGGFAACKRSIVPEAYFARQLLASDSYSFLRAAATLGIQSNKSTQGQQHTALRIRYPQVHRRPENVALLTLLELVTLALPFVLAVGGFWLSIGSLAHVLAIVAATLLVVAYELLTLQTRTGNWWFGVPGLFVGTLYDVGLLHRSMWLYEFSTIEWKGRNVCIPAMHVIPHLPKID